MGPALRQGSAFCGRCGRRMGGALAGHGGERPGAVCTAHARAGGAPRWPAGRAAAGDPALAALMLHARAPDQVARAVDAVAQRARAARVLDRQGQLRCARARCAAARAQRQYAAGEPAHRLVARHRATPWEATRRAVEAVQREDAQGHRQPATARSGADRQALLAGGQHRPAVWYAGTTTPTDRQRLGRLVVRAGMSARSRAPAQGWLQRTWPTGAPTQPWGHRRRTREGARGHGDPLRQRRHGCTATGRHAQAMAAGRTEAG